MNKNRRILFAKIVVILAAIPVLILAHAAGPDPRKTGAPGDSTCAESGCHGGGKINTAGGNVAIAFPNGMTYAPGVTQLLTVTVTDAQAVDYGFQATARLESDLKNGQAGDFNPVAGTTIFVLCDDSSVKKTGSACPAQVPVEFIEHFQPLRTKTFQINWTPPASNVGNVHIYIAANAANGNGQADVGDHIYTAAYVLAPASNAAITSVVNAGSFQPGLASGAWVTIFGTGLSSTTRIWGASDFNGNALPTQLDGVSVTIDGKPAAVYFISPGQINVQVPDDAAVGPVPVQVTTAGGTTSTFTAQLQRFAPGFFQVSGTSYAAAVHLDGTYVGKANLIAGGNFSPAKPGETILLYGTGFGATNPALPSGQIIGAAPLATDATILIGGVAADVSFGGLAGAGLYQFNVTIPPATPDGDMPIVGQIGGQSTQTGVLITVQK